jgi:hypothetical protein
LLKVEEAATEQELQEAIGSTGDWRQQDGLMGSVTMDTKQDFVDLAVMSMVRMPIQAMVDQLLEGLTIYGVSANIIYIDLGPGWAIT